MVNFWNISGGAKVLLAICAVVLIAEGVYINYAADGALGGLISGATACERIIEKWSEANPELAKDRPVYDGTIASVNWDTPLTQTQEFKADIEKGIAEGANFAGKYSVTQWSCGEGCQNHAIVNVETGKIIAFGPRSKAGVGIAPESPILIVNPEENFPSPGEIQKASFETLLSLSDLTREYYVLEGEGDSARLQKMCTENPLAGTGV